MQMRFPKPDLAVWWRKSSPWLLALCWATGMLTGMTTAASAGEFLAPLMRQSVCCSASIPGLLAAVLLPFLLSAFAVYLHEPWLLLIISAFKAFSFGFCAFGVSLAFGQSSWLVRFLFLFSDLCLVPVLYVYWLRHIHTDAVSHRWELPGCLGMALLIGWIDYSFIAPFLVSIIES